jgi:hypothetical protein
MLAALTILLTTVSTLGTGEATTHAVEAMPEDVTASTVLQEADPNNTEGWKLRLTLSGLGSYAHNRKVVGTVDGSTVQLGLLLEGEATLQRGNHTWENLLKARETQTRTPQLGRFFKAADEVDLRTTYLYRLTSVPWLGGYGRGRINTQILPGFDVRTADVTVLRIPRKGTPYTENAPAKSKISLTSAFEPLLLKESAGLFARPFDRKLIKLTAKAGVGAQHIIAGDGYSLTDDAATPELELTQLRSSTQGGAEVEVLGSGELRENITWSAGVGLFMPFATSGETLGKSGIDLLNTEIDAKISAKVAEWASLDYVLSAKRIPLVLDAWQVLNSVVLKVTYDFV